MLELRNSLTGRNPGEAVTLRIRDGKSERDTEVQLGKRPELPSYPGHRLRQMELMGGPVSRVRAAFTRVIQTDMRLRPNQIGGPVVDLKGRVIGITMARADRTRSFVMPATAIARMLENEATDPSLANQRDENATPPMRIGRMDPPRDRAAGPNTEQRMRRHLTEMQQLMDFMLEEMSQLEEGR